MRWDGGGGRMEEMEKMSQKLEWTVLDDSGLPDSICKLADAVCRLLHPEGYAPHRSVHRLA